MCNNTGEHREESVTIHTPEKLCEVKIYINSSLIHTCEQTIYIFVGKMIRLISQ